MKKLISIILAIVMIATAVPFAFAEEIEITVDEILTITAPDYGSGDYCYIKFVPEKSAALMFVSLMEGEVDPVCTLYDSGMNEIGYNDDNNSLDFCISHYFVVGETYYFAVEVYDGPAEVDVTLVCGHNFVDGVCTECEKECTHEVGSNKNCSVVCECGLVFEGIEMTEGEEYTVNFGAVDEMEDGWGRFIPEESGVYCFESVYGENSHDCSGKLYDEDFNELAYNDDYDETMMFRIFYYLNAGEAYFICCHSYYEKCEATIKVERVKHTADDGSVHMDMSVYEATDSTCSTPGYSEGIYCNECEEFIIGHCEYGLDPDYHTDEDFDGICDECDEEIFEICKHICHSTNPFLAFIWRIANAIHRLLGISLMCECGIYHYITDEVIPN